MVADAVRRVQWREVDGEGNREVETASYPHRTQGDANTVIMHSILD